MAAIIGLALFAAIYSLFGGFQAVAWTDVVQVVILVAGGLITAWIALDYVGEGRGIVAGMNRLFDLAPAKFNMILDRKSCVWGKSGSVRVDLGGRRIIKKKQ